MVFVGYGVAGLLGCGSFRHDAVLPAARGEGGRRPDDGRDENLRYFTIQTSFENVFSFPSAARASVSVAKRTRTLKAVPFRSTNAVL